jgi:hypothetical protein
LRPGYQTIDDGNKGSSVTISISPDFLMEAKEGEGKNKGKVKIAKRVKMVGMFKLRAIVIPSEQW